MRRSTLPCPWPSRPPRHGRPSAGARSGGAAWGQRRRLPAWAAGGPRGRSPATLPPPPSR
eukprot:2892639-Lingulodinium_polyedra.AAC.1